ncbi:unnamed protein product [marine sediment metagenome]|uniref:Uncharacterized protein n=1 Tax=marine sediment metagenome TaxID=412755 RepID=X1MC30_9ZZZZ
MRKAITLGGWQLSFSLTLCRQRPNPDLKLPTQDELKAMAKAVYRKFNKAKRDGVP